MNDVITIGDAMIAFNPVSTGPMKFVDSFKRNIGGAELNVAIGCARLGLKSGWISRLGNDEFGHYIRNFARGEGIDTTQVGLVDGYPTSLNFKEIMPDGSVRTFYYREKSPTLTMRPEDLDESFFKEAKILHITGIFPAIDPNNLAITRRAIELAKQHDVKIAFDPNIRLKLWSKEQAREVLSSFLQDVDILLSGVDEMELILGISNPKDIIEACKDKGIDYIVLKNGDKGSIGYHDGETIEADPVKATKVVDTVGAGDGFDAGFLYSYLQGWSLEKSLHFANTIGSMVVSVIGDNEGLPYLEHVLERLGEKERIER
ncbi:sugar kinase [Tenuibacillus multivorans]|uniref:2-dehydro-3-deoxygluconokinase n=1 Tax=Tenuibacillus multivorans TaxID=237069 RepID=A0A1H0C297_9BACI|nr:sugar kinase [Tenuibacillus multivorans]GEL77738.1 2-dehydro-3-deoxygluconokinase [Tenuibacillus multivorans]SDN51979.1 2-dehydro-3-deoxygluconokinase [Tenuibacillus multivorans]